MVHVAWGLIVACGKTEQIAPEVDTPFLDLAGKPILTYSLLAYERCPEIEGIVIVVQKERIDSVLGMAQMFGCPKVRKIVAGTNQRCSSVQNGLKVLDEEVTMVSVHDASRPCLTTELISETIKTAKKYGSGISAIPAIECVKRVKKGLVISESLDPETLWSVQTPQTFTTKILIKGYDQAAKKKMAVEDDSAAAGLVEKDLHLVESKPTNFKIRTSDDLKIAAGYLRI